jgi:hypothetical protein
MGMPSLSGSCTRNCKLLAHGYLVGHLAWLDPTSTEVLPWQSLGRSDHRDASQETCLLQISFNNCLGKKACAGSSYGVLLAYGSSIPLFLTL